MNHGTVFGLRGELNIQDARDRARSLRNGFISEERWLNNDRVGSRRRLVIHDNLAWHIRGRRYGHQQSLGLRLGSTLLWRVHDVMHTRSLMDLAVNASATLKISSRERDTQGKACIAC